MNIHNKFISLILRIFVGLVFVASAILKYISIDIFDLYVFEHNLFSISVTETLTRLLITAELVLGTMLIFNLCARTAYYAALFFLTGFTLYLFTLPYFFDVDITHCHCFGDAIVLNRTESIIKNMVLLLCLVFVSPKFYTHKKWKIWVVTALSIVAFAIFMIINAPNYLYTMVHKEKIQIDFPMYESALQNSDKEQEFTDGKQIICMYSVGCRFCKRAALKLHLILKNNQLPEGHAKAIFWAGTPDSLIHNFFSEQRVPVPEYTTFRADSFLAITGGRMPVLLFSDHGNIVHKTNFITLNEKKVTEFFSNDN
ncbi:MAG: DoxX family protein [Lentimicrobiaceae bacterium]|nr:DoxX family protein [Lentimicrobiaceae bacterium]